MGLDYQQIYAFGKAHKLVVNRVSIINQLHGCRYDNGILNPCKLKWQRGRYVVTYCGRELCAYRLYDGTSADMAVSVVTALADMCWLGRRQGWIVFVPQGDIRASCAC